MLSVDTIVDTGKVLLGMAVGAATIFFNQIENTEMNKGKMLGLRTTAYAVSDIKAAKAWYTNAFETEPYFDEDFYVGFSIGGYELGLFPNEKASDIKYDGVLSYWGVNDIEESYQYLLEMGATKGDIPRDVGEGILVGHVFDPWNNAIGIIYNPHFKIDE